MNKLYAYYSHASTWDLDEIFDELGITREDVVRYHIKWDSLTLTYKDSQGNQQQVEYDPNEFSASDDPCWKRPNKIILETEEGEIEL